MTVTKTFEDFASVVVDVIHSSGHNIIGSHCTDKNKDGDLHSAMSFSVVSARDPIFYRWHNFLEDIVQRYRDTQLPQYVLEDFDLQDDVRIQNVKTIINSSTLSSRQHLENVLITYPENATVQYSEEYKIDYPRINHLPFKFVIDLDNPKMIRKRVIVRLWLGMQLDNQKYNLIMNSYLSFLLYLIVFAENMTKE